MKKLMIGSLLLIPIIIMVVVVLTSGFVSAATYIGVESITLSTNYYEIDTFPARKTFYAKDFLNPVVSPSRATYRTVTWIIDEVTYLDSDYEELYEANKDTMLPAVTLIDSHDNPVEENQTGAFTVSCYCSFEIIAQAENKQATCRIVVGGTDVNSVTISYDGNKSFSGHVGDALLLYTLLAPVSTKSEEFIWESTNESVAKVNQNGIVDIVGVGTANITLKVAHERKEGKDLTYCVSNEFQITSSASSSIYGSKFYSSRTTLSCSALSISGASAVSGCSVEGDTITITGEQAVINTSNGQLTIYTCDDTDIQIDNANIISADSGYILGVGEESLYLTASFKSKLATATPEVVWSVSGGDFAINNGVLTAAKDGMALVTATCGGKTAEITIHAETKVRNMVLGISNASQRIGIARETIYPSGIYNDTLTEIGNYSIEVGVTSPELPADKFNYSVDKTDYAHFEGNKLVFHWENVPDEKTILNVTVSAKYPLFYNNKTYTTSTFAVKVIKGVAVNSCETAIKVAEGEYRLIFISDVEMKVNGVNVYNDMYGNNHYVTMSTDQESDVGWAPFTIRRSATVSNIQIKCNEVDETITNSADRAKGLTWTGLRFQWDCQRGYEDRFTGRLEYSIIENANILLRAFGCDITVDGCVFRNSSNMGIYMDAEKIQNPDGEWFIEYTHMTIKNCIMSNMLATAISCHYSNENFFDHDDKGNIIGSALDDTLSYDKERNTTLTQQGFLDIYNWQNLKEVDLMGGAADIPDIAKLALSAATEEIFGLETFKPYIYPENDAAGEGQTTNYVHMGIISTGFINPSVFECTFEDDRFHYIDLRHEDLGDLEDLFGVLLKEKHFKLWVYDKNANLTPKSKYVLDRYTLFRLHPEE